MNSSEGDALVLELDSRLAVLATVGGKGASLARLAVAGLPVPAGFHVTTDAYRRFVNENHLAEPILAAAALAKADDPASLERASTLIRPLMLQGSVPLDIAALVCSAYRGLGPDWPPVAVRSSATAEDLPDMSFAGQHETYLNVRGDEQLLESLKRCWGSLWTARALGYRARYHLRSDEVALAVVVQHLVPAEVAGVLFTVNPLTGARTQMVINAAWGLGEAIVGGHVTPDLFVIDAGTGTVAAQTIADKVAMTVRQPGGTREEPVPPEKRRQPALKPQEAAELARLGTQIERLYGQPMDVEWALVDGRPFILQARPITALPVSPVALEWALPRPGARYFRSSVIELLPEPVSPLFATLALPLWNRSMRNQMKLMAQSPLTDRMQTLVTINDYAYYEFGLSAWQLMRVICAILWRAKFILPYCTSEGEARWRDEALPRYARAVSDWAACDLNRLSAAALLDGVRDIVGMAADYYLTIQTGILPAAFGSEALFTTAYNRLTKRKSDPAAVTFLLGFDSVPIQGEKRLYDLARWAKTQPALAAYLTCAASADVAAAFLSRSTPVVDTESWSEFCHLMSEHLDRFGHAVYDLDFARNLPTDDPTPLFEMLKHFLNGQARSPYDRQAISAAAREQASQSLLTRGGLRGWLFRRLLPWAQRFAPLREDALAELGLGWPVVRQLSRELGRRLAGAGCMASPDDVFWLRLDEAEAAAKGLDERRGAPDYRDLVSERKATAGRERTVTPPATLPVKGGARFFGIDFSGMMPARSDQAVGQTIKGQGASAGRVAGVARVIHGSGEFGEMQRGDILVAKVTTPAWTPLFALAAGIVTDVGGPLSHSSIVAREYRIPAVLGTGVATDRIRSGQRIIVDGDRGVVTMGESIELIE